MKNTFLLLILPLISFGLLGFVLISISYRLQRIENKLEQGCLIISKGEPPQVWCEWNNPAYGELGRHGDYPDNIDQFYPEKK